MNADVLKGKWHQLKGEVKSQWGKLTDDDLDRVEGDAEQLASGGCKNATDTPGSKRNAKSTTSSTDILTCC